MSNKTETYNNQYKALINTETLQEGSTLYVIADSDSSKIVSTIHIYTTKILVQKNLCENCITKHLRTLTYTALNEIQPRMQST